MTPHHINQLSELLSKSTCTLGENDLVGTTTQDKISLVCLCGNIFYKRYFDIKPTTLHCRYCSAKKRSASRINDVGKIKQFVELSDVELLTTTNVRSHDNMELRCKCGNVYKQTLSDFRSIRRRGRINQCPSCSRLTAVKSHTHTYEEVADFVNRTGCQLVTTEYQSYNDPMEIICRICSCVFVNTIKDFKNNGTFACSSCTCNHVSFPETEIQKYLTNELHVTDIVTNDRLLLSGKEVDIYIPSLMLGIEFDGIYYHCEAILNNRKNVSPRTYHLHKTAELLSKNIQLLHIFENEWKNIRQKDIWLSILAVKCKRVSSILYARKCRVCNITQQQSHKFLDDNHLQGSISGMVNIGLFADDHLVGVICLDKPRFNKQYQWELLRMAFLKNTVVVGGAGKMLKFFENHHHPKSLITYADRRYSTGYTYNQLGFTLIGYSKPGYFYTKSPFRVLYNRLHFQKHKLSKKLDVFDSTLSEVDNMKNNGYYRIWDCGNIVFVKKFTPNITITNDDTCQDI
jgi:hypothetical protein